MTQCSATSVLNHTVIELSWIPFRFAYRGRLGTEGDQGHQPGSLLTAATLQMGRAERQTAAAGSCQLYQSATDGSAYSVGTGTDTQRPEDWGQEQCSMYFAVIIKPHIFLGNILVMTVALIVPIKLKELLYSFDQIMNAWCIKPKILF